MKYLKNDDRKIKKICGGGKNKIFRFKEYKMVVLLELGEEVDKMILEGWLVRGWLDGVGFCCFL